VNWTNRLAAIALLGPFSIWVETVQAQDQHPVPIVPSPQTGGERHALRPMVVKSEAPERSGEELLQITINTLFELIEKPDPRYATFASVSGTARLFFIETKFDGHGAVMLYSGAKVRPLLQSLFRPGGDVRIERSKPEISVDGAFARVKLELRIFEPRRKVQTANLYIDAILEKPRSWTLVQFTLTQYDALTLKP
jgi:hypothetical protein